MKLPPISGGDLPRVPGRIDPWNQSKLPHRLETRAIDGRSASRPRIREGPIRSHEQLFTSGAYVREFQPEARANPFAGIYAQKRDAVIGSVAGHDQRVLDVGGGMGRMAVPLSRDHFVTLTDISPQMLELAKPHASERLQLEVADAQSLPFPDGAFDFVLCIDVLPHVLQPRQMLAEARRVLRPGGTLIIDATNSVPVWTLAFPRYLGRRPSRWVQIWRAGGVLPEWRTRVRHHRKRQFLSFLDAAGFEVTSVRGFGPRACPKWHLATAVRT
jgi:ubiquinone/menaquinone biosynthesis C-methylase UbiE